MSKNARTEDSFPRQIPYGRQTIDESDIAAVVEVLRSNFVTQGPRIEIFEQALAEYTGARYAIAVSSGTAALHLSCLGLGLGLGDLGLVPAITFAATANCLKYVGADVLFVDVDPLSGIADTRHYSEAIERSVSQESQSRIGAILPVSFKGSVPSLEGIAKLARAHDAFVIEDAAHSIGAHYRLTDGSLAKSASCRHSDAAILSFHPVKHICAGEGGAVLTNDRVLADRVRKLRSHGIRKQENWLYDQEDLGLNYRMTEMQAALATSQLGKLDRFLTTRSELEVRYRIAFAEEPFLKCIRLIPTDELSARHLFVIHFETEEERKDAYHFMHLRGIRVQVHYLPVYRHAYYKESAIPLVGSEQYYATCLSLPMYHGLSFEDQDFVIETLGLFLGQ